MQKTYEFGEFRLETAERQLLRQGIALSLPPKVFDTLVLLVESAGRLLLKEELMKALWPDTFVADVSLAQNISQLRKALGETAGGGQMIQTVAKQGYRFTAPVRVVSEEGTGSNLADAGAAERVLPTADAGGEAGDRARNPVPLSLRRRAWIGMGVAAALVLGGLSYLIFSRARTGGASDRAEIQSIAVLPLTNLSADPEQEFFADGMTDDLITELARIRALRVISRTSVMQYKGTRKTLPEIARELNVDAVVEGTISQRAGQVHVTAQLVKANPETHIWAESYERPVAEAGNLQSELAREIAGAVQATMTPAEQARMRRSRAANAEANLLYLKGKYFWNKRTTEGLREAEKYFQEAIAKDGSFAEAYVGLAGVYILEGGFGTEPATVLLPKAEAAARRALELDPESGEAHAALGLIAMNYEWDWAKAEREYKLALGLSPNDALAHHWYGEFLTGQGRFEEALAELRRAEELDPLSLAITADRGKALYFSRRYDEAIAQLEKALEMDPGFVQAHYVLVRAYGQKGAAREAENALGNLRHTTGETPAYWALVSVVDAKIGRRDGVRQAVEKGRVSAGAAPDPAIMLYLEIGEGDANEAFAWLDRCYEKHSTAMTSLRVNPDYDGLRGDPRFAKYLERVGLAN
jgi:TolB-like protein/DNA-binding winged helix-turn-helix (wHTH) protein/Flp pilus assembly protein TadD